MNLDAPVSQSRNLASQHNNKHEANDTESSGARDLRVSQQLPGSFGLTTDGDTNTPQSAGIQDIGDRRAVHGVEAQPPAEGEHDAWNFIASAENPQELASPEDLMMRMQRMSRKIDRRDARIRKLKAIIHRSDHRQESQASSRKNVKPVKSRRRAKNGLFQLADDHASLLSIAQVEAPEVLPEESTAPPDEAELDQTVVPPTPAEKGKGRERSVQTSDVASELDLSTQRMKAWRAVMDIDRKHLFVMIRFRDFSEKEKRQEAAKLDYTIDHEAKTITIRDAAKAGNTLPSKPHLYRGFDAIVDMGEDNGAVWDCCAPAFTAFTGGHPVCILFDGYSGTGKSWTMFDNNDAIANRLATEIWAFVKGKRLDPAVIVEACSFYKKKKEILVHRRTYDVGELNDAIDSARVKRDGKNAATTNNPRSSRSHLTLEFIVKARKDSEPFTSSFCLVDLAGAERAITQLTQTATMAAKKNPRHKTATERQALFEEERKLINESRTGLHDLLLYPTNPGFLHRTKLNESLRKYLYFKDDTGRTGSNSPKCILFSLLSPRTETWHETNSTLDFIKSIKEPKVAAEPAKPDAAGKKDKRRESPKAT